MGILRAVSAGVGKVESEVIKSRSMQGYPLSRLILRLQRNWAMPCGLSDLELAPLYTESHECVTFGQR